MIAARTATDFALHGVEPSQVVSPASVDELRQTLAEAVKDGRSVVPWGGGTRQGLGLPPAHYDIALDLSGLDRVVEYEPADLTVTVQAGMRMGTLQALLASHNQALALDPPFGDRATVGGTLAANIPGPCSHRYGGPRERVIGLRAALVDGTTMHAGGRVVKNVAGYDLARLFVGSLGTLGIITEVSFKLAARPPVAATAVCRTQDIDEALRVASRVLDLNLPLTALEVGRAEQDYVVALDCSGRPAVVDRIQRDLKGLGDFDTILDDAYRAMWSAWRDAGLDGDTVVLRAVTLPGASRDLVSAHAGERFQWRPGTGVLRVFVPSSEPGQAVHLHRLLARAAEVTVEHAASPLPAEVPVWPAVGAGTAMRRLRDTFDPAHTLNPGRFVTP